MRPILLAIFLLAPTPLFAADAGFPIDTRQLVDVRTIEAFPADIKTALGRQKTGVDGFADLLDKFNATDVVDTKLPMRRFLAGGASSTAALLAYEQGGRAHSLHAVAFSLRADGWKKVGEWVLPRRPMGFRGVLQLVDSKEYPDLMRQYLARQPSRRDGPLRETNISDVEVREIQAIAAVVSPGAIVNISGVVTGCPCEDGPACTDQVWIVAHRDNQSHGLQLSKIDDHWAIGAVQQWWLDWDSLQASRRQMSRNDFFVAEEAMQERLPQCLNPTTNVENVSARDHH